MTLHQINSMKQAQIQGKFQLSRGRRALSLPRYVKEIDQSTQERREALLTNQLSPSLKDGYDTFLKPLKGWMLWMDGWMMDATSFFIYIHDSHFAFSSIGITPAPKNTWNHVHIKLGSCGRSMYANASFIHIHEFHFAFSSIGIQPIPPPKNTKHMKPCSH